MTIINVPQEFAQCVPVFSSLLKRLRIALHQGPSFESDRGPACWDDLSLFLQPIHPLNLVFHIDPVFASYSRLCEHGLSRVLYHFLLEAQWKQHHWDHFGPCEIYEDFLLWLR